ncbi:CBS domain-containing protein [Chitinilyticum piscinae]|uniref:CBS domain-containing protein n=1 Tax=Chitinilyticum piscinae TaxID=2866724 RepID=A0A8J7FIV7_9NEIS|nr:CBS domain-containing protein [Chitinilyticum piscinae]MBE9608262.1 CBS domain-containing protein [Chitinilyticum piscinae]
MFSVYGITGRVFHGTRSELDTTPGLYPARRIAAVARNNEESTSGFQLPLPGKLARNEYLRTQQLDHERGPVFSCGRIMHSPVITADAALSVQDAWQLLHAHGIHQCPVLQDGQLVGLVSDRDLLTSLVIADGIAHEVLQRQVADVMRTPVLVVSPDTDLRHVTALMLDHALDGVPVLAADQGIAGFISKTDILRAVSTEPALSLWG